MPSSEREEPKFQLPQLVLLITAIAGGVWLYESPLKSSRPVQSEESRRSTAVVDTRVEARLWQDPFEAVDTHIKLEKSAKGGHPEQGPGKHSHQLTQLTAELADSFPLPIHIEILAVLADGSPYADGQESRLRQRFAVLSGLERADYAPVDVEHMRFFYWPEEEPCKDTSLGHQGKTSLQTNRSSSTEDINPSISVIPKSSCARSHDKSDKYEYWRHTPVPVEWYRSKKTALDGDVLVFWIKDQDLGNRPTKSLRAIQHTVMHAFPPFRPTVSFKVIGPRFSGTLQAMIDEINVTEEVNSQDALTIYSPWSTAPEDSLIPNNHDNRSVAQHLKKVKTTFIRTIPTDEQLVDTLFDEMERRGVTLECESEGTCNRIAVISEWDTLYGRILPDLVKNRISDWNNGRSIGFDQFSYLRGLDGELPQAKPQDNSGTSSGDKAPSILSPKDRRQDIERMERPEGRSQLDYVRQLTELIREKEENFRAECDLWKTSCPGFKAIGVLGSDVYDKLLILQALKKSFPHVIFFTTDLDARLFHPSELAWTRNLVVASHFDLKLNEKLQYTIPPFRDTYQTATFFTILRALDSLKESDACPKKPNLAGEVTDKLKPSDAPILVCFEEKIRTKLHEIGRNGPVDISMNIDLSARAQRIEAINSLRLPPPNANDARYSLLKVIGKLLAVFVLLIPISVTIFKWAVTPRTIKALGTGLLVFIGLLITACYWFIPYLVSDQYGGEPFSLFDEVSIWPSQILRATVVALALLLLWLLYHFNRRDCEDLEELFPTQLSKHSFARGASSLPNFFSQACQMSIGKWALETEVNQPPTVWKQYRERLLPRWTFFRVGFWTLLFWATASIVLRMTGMPFTPFRGNVSFHINVCLLQLAVLCLLSVIFYVLDVTRLTSVFVGKLIPDKLRDLPVDGLITRLRIIAQLTNRIDTFIYYPAGLLILMLSARSNYIDNWDFPVGLMIVIGLSAFYVIVSAFQLRWASERARRRVLDELSRKTWIEPTSNSGAKKEIQQAIDEVKGLNEGAFMPITHLPVFRAVTLPTGAAALLALFEALINN